MTIEYRLKKKCVKLDLYPFLKGNYTYKKPEKPIILESRRKCTYGLSILKHYISYNVTGFTVRFRVHRIKLLPC
jgi:hypothetical protein